MINIFARNQSMFPPYIKLNFSVVKNELGYNKKDGRDMGSFLLTWFDFTPTMDK